METFFQNQKRHANAQSDLTSDLSTSRPLPRKVYEEKQRRCESEMEELRQSCATKMKQASQKAQRAQQVLQLQVASIFKYLIC